MWRCLLDCALRLPEEGRACLAGGEGPHWSAMAAEEGTPPLAVLDDKKWKVENVEGTMDEPKVSGSAWERSSSWLSTLALARRVVRRELLRACVGCA